ncbi:MAG: SLBB domain-containing protein [Oscillospiraceae bacterium]|nr:SLBB domain-containing protein [Oscillospiraceae bacterium]
MKEQYILLRNRNAFESGTYHPLEPAEYRATGGFDGLERALNMSADAVIEEVRTSGLRGRGGAGFPTWRKFTFCVGDKGDGVKYVVCNADEGEPGTNKDRELLTVDPCAVFEGMAIAAKAINAHFGYIYLRAEYSFMRDDLCTVMERCREQGFLGKNILGSGFDFDIDLRMGNGAYVCGEETALFESLEGKRGEPRLRPPYPGDSGLFGKPTLLNNVETLCNLPAIFRMGAEQYKQIGVPGSTGTKLFTVSGNVRRRGVFEFPMGINLKELVYDFCGGVPEGQKLLGVQTGGASGAIINASQVDISLDIDNVSASGGRLACGTIMVYSDRNCIVDILCNNLDFFREESCGKCTPCREGGTQLYHMIRRISEGDGEMRDLRNIEEVCNLMYVTSRCGLGTSTTMPIMSCLRNFRLELISHIDGDECPVCKLKGGKSRG